MSRRGWGYFVFLGIVWGLPYLLIKVSVRELSPALLLFIRTGGAAVVFVPLAAARGAFLPALKHWRPILLFTCSEFGLSWLLLFSAERHLSSSLSGLMTAAVPLVAAVLAWATGSDRVDLRRGSGLVLGIAGVALLVGFDVSASQTLAVLSMIVVVIGYAAGPWVIAHRLTGVDPIGALACSFAFCTVAYAPVIAFVLPTRALAPEVVASAATLTVLCTVVAFLAFFALIKEVGAMRTTLITYVNPAVAVVLGVAVLHEHFGWATGAGFVAILAGCYLATRPVAHGSRSVVQQARGGSGAVVPTAPGGPGSVVPTAPGGPGTRSYAPSRPETVGGDPAARGDGRTVP